MSAAIHVCILTTAHATDDMRVREKFGRTFLDEGFRVSWVGPDRTLSNRVPNCHDGIHWRLFPAGKSRLGRLLAYREVRNLAKDLGAVDIYYAPDPDSATVALELARRQGAKVVFDVHEVYHGPMLDHWLRGWRLPFVRDLVRHRISRICAQCDLVIGVSNAVLEPYLRPCRKRIVVRSCAPASFATDPPADVCHPARQYFTLMHGKSNLSRGTLEVLAGLEIAQRRFANFRAVMFNGFACVTEGEGRVFSERVRALHLQDAVDLRQCVSLQEMPAILRNCDAGLIAYGRRFGSESLPNRLFEYLAAGLPVIVPEYAREIVKIVEPEACGLAADFERPECVAEALIYLRQHPEECRRMGQRAREAFVKRHNWNTEIRPVIDCFRQWHDLQRAA